MIIDYIVSKKVMLYVYRVINMYILVRKKNIQDNHYGRIAKRKLTHFNVTYIKEFSYCESIKY